MDVRIKRILDRHTKKSTSLKLYRLAQEVNDISFDIGDLIADIIQKSQQEFETIIPKIKDWLIGSIKELERKKYDQSKILGKLEQQLTAEYSKEKSPLIRGIYIKILKMIREWKVKGIQVPESAIKWLKDTAIRALQRLGVSAKKAKDQVDIALNQLRAELKDFDDLVVDPTEKNDLLSDLIRKAINVELY